MFYNNYMQGGDLSYLIFFFLLPLLIGIFSQININSKYKKYSKIGNRQNITGSQVANQILNKNNLNHIRVEQTTGKLTDNFNPRDNAIRLSADVYNSTSIAALGIAAHEAGHALQYGKNYSPIKLRNSILPVANIGSQLAFPIAILGYVLTLPFLIDIGIVLFSFVCLFQLITLPVEFNASARAMKILREENFLYAEELTGARKVLTAAALTYVASLSVTILSLLRLLSMRNRR